MITIGSSTSALVAQRRVAEASDSLARTFERLSSGQRIGRASDDAAGLAIADSLRVDARLYGAAIRNVSDGISMISIATGALSQQTNILGRLMELAEQSANGTFSNAQRATMQREYAQLISEFGRLADATSFNGLFPLLGGRGDQSGVLSLQAGIRGNLDSVVRLSTSDTGTLSGTVNLDALQTADFNGVNGVGVQDLFDYLNFVATNRSREAIFEAFDGQVISVIVKDAEGNDREALVALQYGSWNEGTSPQSIGFHLFVEDSAGGGYVPASSNPNTYQNGSRLIDSSTGLLLGDSTISLQAAGVSVSLDVSGLVFQSGAVTGQTTSVLELSGIENMERALSALDVIGARRAELSAITGRFGALESRLNTALELLRGARETYTQAESRIRDADVSAEAARLVATQILQQTSAAVLSQATQQPALALQLLN